MAQVKIDLIAHHPATGYALILVQEGPWLEGSEERELRRLQARLHDYVDVAVDGHLAKLHPDSGGTAIRIQVNGYDLPDDIVAPFVERFAQYVRTDPELARAVGPGKPALALTVEYKGGTLRTGDRPGRPDGDG